jgi:hypothetical protein
MDDQLTQARVFNTVYKRQIITDRPERVPGAKAAHRIEAVYTETSPSGGDVRVRIVDIYALTQRGTMLDFVARAPAAEFDQTGLPQTLQSFRVTA